MLIRQYRDVLGALHPISPNDCISHNDSIRLGAGTGTMCVYTTYAILSHVQIWATSAPGKIRTVPSLQRSACAAPWESRPPSCPQHPNPRQPLIWLPCLWCCHFNEVMSVDSEDSESMWSFETGFLHSAQCLELFYRSIVCSFSLLSRIPAHGSSPFLLQLEGILSSHPVFLSLEIITSKFSPRSCFWLPLPLLHPPSWSEALHILRVGWIWEAQGEAGIYGPWGVLKDCDSPSRTPTLGLTWRQPLSLEVPSCLGLYRPSLALTFFPVGFDGPGFAVQPHALDWRASPQNAHVGAPTDNVTVGKAFLEIIRVKWGHGVRSWSNRARSLIWKRDQSFSLSLL